MYAVIFVPARDGRPLVWYADAYSALDEAGAYIARDDKQDAITIAEFRYTPIRTRDTGEAAGYLVQNLGQGRHADIA